MTSGGFKVQPINLDTLHATLLGMKASSSTGIDGVNVAMLQKFFAGFGDVLLDVLNSSLHTGIVPLRWKHALVTPIPKCKVVTSPADTRPISILPAMMKVVEKVVQIQLTEYFESHHLFSSRQHGYRKHHSTETALSVISDKVLSAMDRGEISILVLLDQSKCFDVVPHQQLLDKLSLYGIHTEWFSNYLLDHVQQVVMRCAGSNTLTSDVKRNLLGVYQGGSLSCLLYAIFSNDLCLHAPDNVYVGQYADDVTLLTSGKKKDLPQLIQQMESALASLFQWFCQHNMKVNESKTQMMILGTPAMLRDVPQVSLSFNGSRLCESETVRSLGLVIDRHLNFQAHVDSVVSRCTGALIALSHARHVIPRSTLPNIIQALVISIVRYCISIYGSCSATQLHRIQKLINFGARVVSGRRRSEHISDVIRDLGWMSAEQLVEYHTVCAVQRALTTGSPEYIHNTIGAPANQRHDHETRDRHKRTLPRIRSEAGRRRLNYHGVLLANNHDIDQSSVCYRAKLKQSILNR